MIAKRKAKENLKLEEAEASAAEETPQDISNEAAEAQPETAEPQAETTEPTPEV